MNILILSPFNPWPPVQGGKIRILNIIKNISKSHSVSLAAIVDDMKREDIGPLREFCDEVELVERPARLWKDRYAFLTGHLPYNVIRYASKEMTAVLRKMLKRRKFDLVQIEFSLMWQYAYLFRNIPLVLDAHNIEYEVVRGLAKLFRNPIKKISYVMEEKRLRHLEESAWRESSLCFAVSERDRMIIGEVAPDKAMTLPNGVDLNRFEFHSNDRCGKRLLFIGGMDYLPNLDSANYFLSKIFPLVLSEMPDARLDVVGRELWRIDGRGSLKAVEFHEDVPDVLPFFRTADLLAVPLRYGAGTRIKILEAMAAGLPVVTTSKGCEGIDARDGEHLLIADSPGAFGSAVARLMEDRGLRTSLTTNARRLVEDRYSWERIVGEMAEHYETQIAGSR
jgi:glycosyltransferase involved in cell wall biosynthesis